MISILALYTNKLVTDNLSSYFKKKIKNQKGMHESNMDAFWIQYIHITKLNCLKGHRNMEEEFTFNKV